MKRSDVLKILREHEGELKADGVMHLRLFGSVARGDASVQSDVDLIADFDESQHLTLVTIGRVQGRLSELLGTDVDLSSARWMNETVRAQALREAILAF